MAMRTTITLDDTLYAKLKQLTGSRGMNQFISEVLWEKIQQLEREKLQSLMKEGYLATKADRAELNADWQVVDVEGWKA
jgi:hypothetical protein